MADGGVGVLSGIMGGLTGFGGILPTIWSGLRGWPKDEQRLSSSPLASPSFSARRCCWVAPGRSRSIRLVLGLPAMLAGTWLGPRLYGRLDETGFRKVVLLLLLVSGVGADITGVPGAVKPIVVVVNKGWFDSRPRSWHRRSGWLEPIIISGEQAMKLRQCASIRSICLARTNADGPL